MLSDITLQLVVFSSKALILLIMILLLVAGILALFSRGKEKVTGRVSIKNLNEKYSELTEFVMNEILTKKQLKKFLKEKKLSDKAKKELAEHEKQKKVFVLTFNGDMKASAVCGLRNEVDAIVSAATTEDEVVVRLDSAGGMVHAYGLAAAQLQRLRNHNIMLTVTVDKIAASGGYLMASVANKILAAPFAIIGSIGVIVQLPNFHRYLKDKHIDFEQLTAGNFKRTLTLFGQNTEAGREKLQEEIEDIHDQFKGVIKTHRPQLDIDKVATGEHWLGAQALDLKLVDELMTSDDYLMAQSKIANVYEVCYQPKKSLGSKLFSAMGNLKYQLFEKPFIS